MVKLRLTFFIINFWFVVFSNSCTNNIHKTEPESAINILTEKEMIYKKAGKIKVVNTYAALSNKKSDNGTYDIELNDIEKFIGYLNGDLAGGFILNKIVLDSLYKGKLPVRGDIKLAVPRYNDLVVVSSFITGAKIIFNQLAIEKSNLFVDSRIQPNNEDTISMMFGRIDEPITYKVTFDRTKLASREKLNIIEDLNKKIREETITEAEMAIMQNMLYNIVRHVITDMPEGLITVKRQDEYKFPE